ncbi:hypothetical protein XENTR_v10001015 [Xenopus tropicalis]|uniref:Interleukin-8 n=1 Tax=Xenopus tropicalis TaxID=8364 RepID=A0A1B8Y8K7_XENTR|eukprot:XP_002942576.1 PREDICTED: interleukin-8-like [Xenopus tropicalis]
MSAKIFAATFAFCLLYTAFSKGVYKIKTSEGLRCQCIHTHSAFIPPRLYKSVELIPSGPHCKNVEVIITITSGERVCVDPSQRWVQRIINSIIESNNNKELLTQIEDF